MRFLVAAVTATLLVSTALPALADRDDHGHGYGRNHGEQRYRDARHDAFHRHDGDDHRFDRDDYRRDRDDRYRHDRDDRRHQHGGIVIRIPL